MGRRAPLPPGALPGAPREDQRKNPLVIPGRGEKKEAFKIYQSVLVFKHIMLLNKT